MELEMIQKEVEQKRKWKQPGRPLVAPDDGQLDAGSWSFGWMEAMEEEETLIITTISA